MTVKRFIAGAVCPRCGEMDRLRTWRDDVREYRECVDCGYDDAMRLDGSAEPEELKTRVNKEPEQKLASSSEQVIKFVPNPANKKS
ncbi:MAG: YheV family putative zinc ribbon protein [Motiliproteus sp.]